MPRTGNILGLNEKILDKFSLLREKKEEFKAKKKRQANATQEE
jgi:hypothetical protein